MNSAVPLFWDDCTTNGTPVAGSDSIASISPVSVIVPAGYSSVFNFFADIENLPRWAGGYCECLMLQRGGWTALTAEGEQWVELETDAASGCIDLRTGPSAGRMVLTPLRVSHLSERQTLVSLFPIATPEHDANSFLRRSRLLREALLQFPERWERADRKLVPAFAAPAYFAASNASRSSAAVVIASEPSMLNGHCSRGRSQ